MGDVSPAALRAEAARFHDAASRLEAAADALDGPGPGVETLLGRGLLPAVDAVVAPGERLHYREIMERLRAEGKSPGGRDPASTLLALLSRTPHYASVRPRSGEFFRDTDTNNSEENEHARTD